MSIVFKIEIFNSAIKTVTKIDMIRYIVDIIDNLNVTTIQFTHN